MSSEPGPMTRCRSCWSIAFEAFPYGPDLHGVFKRTVGNLLGEWPLEALSAENSMSYPAWLSKLVTD
jgi:cytochrome c2